MTEAKLGVLSGNNTKTTILSTTETVGEYNMGSYS